MSKKNKKKSVHKRGLPPGTLVYTGDRETRPAQLRTVVYNVNGAKIAEEYLPGEQAEGSITWIDVRGINDISIIQMLGERYNIHPLVLEDVLNTHQRPKAEEYSDDLFVVLPNIQFDPRKMEMLMEQISIYYTEKTIITFQEDGDDTLASVMERIRLGNGRIRKRDADYLLYALIDVVVDNYFMALENIEHKIFDIENDLYTQSETADCRNDIFALKHVLSHFRNRMMALRDALARLHRSDSRLLPDDDQVFLRDVADHVAQAIDQIESFKDQLLNLDTLLQAEISNKMNGVMKLLAAISTIFIPLSFLAGVYGMNFKNMPELEWQNGYFMLLGLMLVIMLGMLWYFRQKKWI